MGYVEGFFGARMIGNLLGRERGMLSARFWRAALVGLVSLTFAGQAQAAPIELVAHYQNGIALDGCGLPAGGGQTVNFPTPGSYVVSVEHRSAHDVATQSNATVVTLNGANLIVGYDKDHNWTVLSNVGTIASAGPRVLAISVCNNPTYSVWRGFSLLFTPDAPSAAPLGMALGPIAGGSTVTVTGSNFIAGVTEVTIGGNVIPAASVTVNSATSLSFAAPAHTAGNVSLSVTTPGGTANVPGGYTYMDAPTVGGLSPSGGPISGGTLVTVTGTNFLSGNTTVTIGGVVVPTASVFVGSSTSLSFASPAHAAGNVDVTVTTPGGTSNLIAGGFTYAAAPTATSLSEIYGPAAGGTVVTIAGTNFVAGGTTVSVGGAIIPAGAVTVNSPTSLTITMPGLGSGNLSISVSTAGGASGNVPGGFTFLDAPTTSPAIVTSGPTAGGTVVTISGLHFAPGHTTVTIGGTTVPAASVTVNASTSLTFTTPAHAAGNVAMTVSTPGGTSNAVPGGFTYLPLPAVTALNPVAGSIAGGTNVTISGSDFVTGATSVTIGGTLIPAGSVTVNSSTSLTFTTPANAAGNVAVTVTTAGGTSGTIAGGFTYAGLPSVTAISPAAGPAAGGTTVIITGTAFVGPLSVSFGPTVAASVTVNSDTSITALSPPGSGAVDITVTTLQGTSPVTPAASFSYAPPTGTVTIRQITKGGDGTFGFVSPTPGLNLAITTTNGAGEASPITLAPGNYSISAMQNAGFGLTAIACDSGAGDPATGIASITVVSGASVVCAFTSYNSQAATTQLIENFMAVQGAILMSNLPEGQRRVDRLQGVVQTTGNPVPALMGYMAAAGNGTLQMPVLSASLAQINAITDQPQTDLDVWFQATLGSYSAEGLSGTFGIVSAGADYLVSKDLLIGGFVQGDFQPDARDGAGGSASGKGWLAGPYATLRLTEGLYLDLLGGVGQSHNSISPDGTYTDTFSANRWLASGSLSGQWQSGDWTISPTATLSYFQSTSGTYVDSLGVAIPSVTGGMGQLALGPTIAYRFELGDGLTVNTRVALDGVFRLTQTKDAAAVAFHTRLNAGFNIATPGGASFGLSGGLDGLGGGTNVQSGSGKLSLVLPIN